MADEIINRVTNSGLITIDLEDFYPEGERVFYDIKQNLWEGIALKEKDFRAFLKENDWSEYENKYVAIGSSVDAIIPTWAYMLLSFYISPFAKKLCFGTIEDLDVILFEEALNNINFEDYKDQRLVIKGCSNKQVPTSAYVRLSTLLQPLAKSIMFGEACSTVPLYKKKRPTS